VVSVNDMPQFTRVVNLGCEALVQALASNRGVSRDEAECVSPECRSDGHDAPFGDLEATTRGRDP